MDVLSQTLLDNTVSEWLTALGVTAAVYAGLRVVAVVFVSRLARLARSTTVRWDDVIVYALQKTKGLPLLVVALFAGSRTLALPDSLRAFLDSLTFIAVLVQVGLWISAAIIRWIAIQREERAAEDGAAVMTMNVVGIAARMAIWLMIFLLALDNVGVDVTALVAGLGVGGIAIALAAQHVLGDLFASLSIVLDRPFVLKDFLVVGEYKGSVEEIGLKTTRVRSLSGEQLIFSNADLLNSRIQNFGRMYQRRIAFPLGVTYQTPRAQLEAIPGMIREAVEAHGDRVRFDRSHFKAYGDFAITFETVYFVLAPDFNTYMDIQQEINLTIHRRFEEAGIDFAYPTQTLFLAREGVES